MIVVMIEVNMNMNMNIKMKGNGNTRINGSHDYGGGRGGRGGIVSSYGDSSSREVDVAYNNATATAPVMTFGGYRSDLYDTDCIRRIIKTQTLEMLARYQIQIKHKWVMITIYEKKKHFGIGNENENENNAGVENMPAQQRQ